MKKFLAIALAVLMLAGCCTMFASCGDSDKIKIGLSGPTTGAAATYGIAVQNSALMAIEEINEKGGLSNGVQLKLLAYDDAHDPNKVANNFAAMQKKGMHVALGCVTSNPCLEFVGLSNKNDVFFLTPSASANDVVLTADHGYQMCFADGNQGAVAGAYVNVLAAAGQLGKLGVLYKSGDPYSEGIYKQFDATILKAIIGEVKVATFTEADETVKFDTQVEQLKDCDFIFMPIYYTPAAKFMDTAKGKVANSAVYYGCDGFDGIDTSVEGFDITTIPQKVTMLSHFNSKATSGAAADYIAKYKARWGEDAPLNQFGASAYDCVYAIRDALNAAIAAGKNVTAEMTAAEICTILTEQFDGTFTFSGATGENIKWNAVPGEAGYVSKLAVPYVIKEANA